VGAGDPSMTRRRSPLPGEGIPQAVYALTECIQGRLMVLFQGTGLHWGLRRLLQELWITDGLSQAELAHAVRSSEASASNMLKHLVSGGWVERRRDQYDYRISRVFLTDKGRALRDAVEQECAGIHEEICQNLGTQDAKRLTALLGSALDRLVAGVEDDDVPGATGIYDAPSPPGQL
jgi:DNA-binding MarR family transcriptional regulator